MARDTRAAADAFPGGAGDPHATARSPRLRCAAADAGYSRLPRRVSGPGSRWRRLVDRAVRPRLARTERDGGTAPRRGNARAGRGRVPVRDPRPGAARGAWAPGGGEPVLAARFASVGARTRASLLQFRGSRAVQGEVSAGGVGAGVRDRERAAVLATGAVRHRCRVQRSISGLDRRASDLARGAHGATLVAAADRVQRSLSRLARPRGRGRSCTNGAMTMSDDDKTPTAANAAIPEEI